MGKEPRGPVRPMLLDSGLFVGATRDFSDGFVGCMRALVLNGVNIDLQGEAVKTDKKGQKYGVYGVGIGCEGKCANSPCKNVVFARKVMTISIVIVVGHPSKDQ